MPIQTSVYHGSTRAHTRALRHPGRYGDIGQACARLAKAFRMRVVALRRRTELSAEEQAAGIVVSAGVCFEDRVFGQWVAWSAVTKAEVSPTKKRRV